MENYPPYTYPDSATSSPRSRELDFDSNPTPTPTPSPTPWDDPNPNPNPNHKVKFMVSYNGKIQPRPHDNLLSYIGGDTKILSVDRSVNYSLIYSKLASLVSAPDQDGLLDFTFKYQLPGEDLDALISVTNDDDLEHMMHEYDRLWRGSNKPARLRLFLFFDQKSRSNSRCDTGGSAFSSVSSEPGKLDRVVVQSDPSPVQNNVDFLFGLDKVVPVQVPGPNPVQNNDMIHEMNRIHHLQMQQQQTQQEYLQPPPPPQQPPQQLANVQQPPPSIPPGYWQQIEQQQRQQEYFQPPQQQPVYMMHAPPPQTNVYHAPPPPPAQPQPMIHQPNQAYFQHMQQRMQSDQGGVYMEQQPVYSTPATMPAMIPAGNTVAYENSTGRQVYYTGATPQQGGVGVVAPSYSGVAVATTVASSEMRGSGDGKVVHKIVSNPNVV